MTFVEYIDNLKQFLLENPETANLQVVYSEDDEGNSYHPVVFTPTKGLYKDNDFDDEVWVFPDDINTVCIN